MDKERKRFQATIDVENIDVVNEEFSKVKVYVQTAGLNRNNSFMSKEVIEKALPTMKYIPVVAEYFEKDNGKDGDFGSHGGKLVIDKDGIRFEATTKPYGLIPSEYNPRWEMQKNSDGDEVEYLVVDAILWSGRYEDLEVVCKNKTNQSMEINANGEFNEDGVFEINEFSYSALCMLGSDVEPCFEMARVETYSVNNIDDDFKEMFEKYQMFIKDKEEIKVKDLKQEENFKVEVKLENDVTIETIDKVVEDSEVFEVAKDEEDPKDDDEKTEDEYVEEVDKPEEEPEEEKQNEEKKTYSLTSRQKIELLNSSIENDVVLDDDGESVSGTCYWVQDYDDKYVYVNRWSWGQGNGEDDNVRGLYTIDEVEMVGNIDKSTFEVVFYEPITKSEKEALENARNIEMTELKSVNENLESEVEAFKLKVTDLETNISNLEQFKADYEAEILRVEKEEFEASVDELISDFEKDLGEVDEFKSIKENKYELTLEELEKECYVLIGKSKHKRKTKAKSNAKFNKSFVEIVKTDAENVVKSEKDFSKYGKMAKYILKENTK